MSVKENLEQVRSKLTEEQVTELGSVLKSLENEVSELQAGLTAANTESKNRKLKLREMEEKLSDFDVEKELWNKKLSEYKEKLEDPTRNKELEELRKYRASMQQRAREGFIQAFGQVHEHPNFENAKHKFVIPEPDEKGNIKWDALSEDDLNKNATTLEELNSIKFFGEVEGRPAPKVVKSQRTGKYSVEEIAQMMNDPDPEVRKQARVLHERRKAELGTSSSRSPFSKQV